MKSLQQVARPRARYGNPQIPPVSQFVLKLHSRCNLRCDYCYVYALSDQRWRHQPRSMPQDTVEQVAKSIARHVTEHGLERIQLTLHGGEPLLAGPALITHVVKQVRDAVGAMTRVDVCVQTNGTLLDEHFLDIFDQLGIMVGVSLDGYASAHDLHRRQPDGRGTHAQVAAALKLLSSSRYRHLFSGLLCTIDLRSEPVAVYEALLESEPPTVDFLLPHGSWSQPPPRPDAGLDPTPYATWLGAIFDRWYRAPRRETAIRLLEGIISLLLGGGSKVEGLGQTPPACAVITTDGRLELSDAMLAVQSDASPEAGPAPAGPYLTEASFGALDAERAAASVLCRACRKCPVGRVCGGGLHAHRYREGHGYANPSVYCADLYALIRHVEAAITADLLPLTAANP